MRPYANAGYWGDTKVEPPKKKWGQITLFSFGALLLAYYYIKKK